MRDAEFGGHRGERGLLIGVQRVAADRWDDLAVQAGAVGRELLEAPVGMPVLGEQRRRLVGSSHDCGDVGVTVDRREERVVAEGPEPEGERFEVVVGQVLVREREHFVGQPRRANRRDGVVVEALQVEAADRRTAGLSAGGDVERHAPPFQHVGHGGPASGRARGFPSVGVMADSDPTLSELVDLSGRRAFVTGGAQGIGAAIARRLIEAGAAVTVGDIDADVATTASTFGASGVVCDVTDTDAVAAALDSAAGDGVVDIVVNNAGIFPTTGPMVDATDDFVASRCSMSTSARCTASPARRPGG